MRVNGLEIKVFKLKHIRMNGVVHCRLW